ncbi:N-terminal glutamine amidase-domain-containing protein [Chytriomyces cf. hyalinus JEL632]|nr:N-terminal glutamine amidase-domain-containing protein [Chytriomyces cf. hyalinus JEL632]
MNQLNKSIFTRTACFCEENVFLLLKHKIIPDPSKTFAVFVSNPLKSVPIWRQSKGDPVVWDYHVFALIPDPENEQEMLVLDLDSTLPFPSPLQQYMDEACPVLRDNSYKRFYRLIRGSEYIQTFASDRRHMKAVDQAGNPVWNAEPPAYAPVQTETSKFNLDRYWTMGPEDVGKIEAGFGSVYDEDTFRRVLCR